MEGKELHIVYAKKEKLSILHYRRSEMGDEVKEKLMYEYELFFLECMCLPKSGIYAKSSEIELKKRLAQLLRKKADSDKKVSKKLLSLENILEEVYRYVKDYEYLNASPEELAQKWFEQICVSNVS
jgi:hypothetical protein